MNPVALTMHSFVVIAAILFGFTFLPMSAAVTLGTAGSIAVLGALVVGTVRKSTGRHHATTGDTSLLYLLLFQQEQGRHRRT